MSRLDQTGVLARLAPAVLCWLLALAACAQEIGPLYFVSPMAAVPTITDLIEKEDWPTLSRYYDLAGSEVNQEDLLSGRFFIRTERPGAAHPAGFWRHKHPFAPGFEFLSVQQSIAPDVVVVTVMVEIDQGGGMVQRGLSTFEMRYSATGYQILPTEAGAHAGPLGAEGQPPEQTVTAVLAGSPAPYTVGVLAVDLRVVIGNASPYPVALRSVAWRGYRDDVRGWRKHLYGSTSERLDGSVVHNGLAQQLAHLPFETGLILPGEHRVVSVPLTPQGDGKHSLVVAYEVTKDVDWMSRVLLPDPEAGDNLNVVYRPATPEVIEARKLSRPGEAIVRAGDKPGEAGRTVQAMQLPIAKDPAAEKTGGLSYAEATRRVGLSADAEGLWGCYRAPLGAWLFVTADGSASALAKDGAEAEGSGGGQWRIVELPEMGATVPDSFGTGSEGTTQMLLAPADFADLVDVKTPYTRMYYYPGVTSVSPERLWAVLRRARDRNMAIELLAINPNGLGTQRVLTAGVKVDSGGRWIEPAIEPRDVPLNEEEDSRQIITVDAMIVDGVTMVPVRPTFEALGFKVEYYGIIREVWISRKGVTIVMTLGSTTGEVHRPESFAIASWPLAPDLYDVSGEDFVTYVPVLAVCEQAGFEVSDGGDVVYVGDEYEIRFSSF